MTSPVSSFSHSDLWSNNLMFKYDGDRVESVKFLDFQIYQGGVPGGYRLSRA